MAQNAQTPATSTSKFSIVRAISAFLKLGDDGKLDSFFGRVVKTLSKEIAAHETNLKTIAFNHEQKLDELKDNLEDAQAALADSFMKVSVEKIGTNEDQKVFMETYLSNIEKHEAAVERVESQIEALKEAHNERVEKINKDIASLKTRIAKIGAEA